jgi:predicted alpha/beta superfamily hydrolase
MKKNILLPFLLAPVFLLAQKNNNYTPLKPDIVTLFSKTLNEPRKLLIYTPEKDTANPQRTYPVLYLLDGDSHFTLLAEYCRYLSRWDVNVIPEMIVVGICNTQRTRDLTPTHSIIDYFGHPDTSATSWLKPSGGNDKFLQFIREELMPYLETHYQTQPFKILAGHSFGGITAINCLLTNPDMFNAYIAISPSFWWDREYLLQLTDKTWAKGTTLNKTLFYSDASEGVADKSTFHANLQKFDSLITQRHIVGLSHKYIYYPEDTHMTEPVKAYYDALRFTFTRSASSSPGSPAKPAPSKH